MDAFLHDEPGVAASAAVPQEPIQGQETAIGVVKIALRAYHPEQVVELPVQIADEVGVSLEPQAHRLARAHILHEPDQLLKEPPSGD